MKKRNHRKISSYLRELSVVVIGVAITLYASNFVTSLREKKDLNQQLKAIYIELEDNIKKIDELIAHYEKASCLRIALLEFVENPQPQNRDSVHKYTYVVGRVETFTYKKGAYEMLLNSGAMKLLDRTQLLDITESYDMLEILKESHDRYADLQTKQVEKLYDLDTKQIIVNYDITEPQFLGIRNFFISVSGKEYYPKETKKQIEKVLSNK